MPHRKRHEAPEARTNQGRVRLGRRTNPGAVYRHGQLLASALRALQPAHHLVIRHVSVAVPGQLLERHEASVPAVAARCAKEHAPAFGYGRERRHSRPHVSTDKAQRQCRLFTIKLWSVTDTALTHYECVPPPLRVNNRASGHNRHVTDKVFCIFVVLQSTDIKR